jgi:hypothetical protein
MPESTSRFAGTVETSGGCSTHGTPPCTRASPGSWRRSMAGPPNPRCRSRFTASADHRCVGLASRVADRAGSRAEDRIRGHERAHGDARSERRLAWGVARDRVWEPRAVATWVIVTDNRTNRRALADHETVLRAKFPTDGRTMRAWLRGPDGSRDGLSFLPWDPLHAHRRVLAPLRRVNRRDARQPERG